MAGLNRHKFRSERGRGDANLNFIYILRIVFKKNCTRNFSSSTIAVCVVIMSFYIIFSIIVLNFKTILAAELQSYSNTGTVTTYSTDTSRCWNVALAQQNLSVDLQDVLIFIQLQIVQTLLCLNHVCLALLMLST